MHLTYFSLYLSFKAALMEPCMDTLCMKYPVVNTSSCLFMSKLLICSLTGDFKRSEVGHKWTLYVRGLGHFGSWDLDWEPGSVTLPRSCQSRPLLHAPLHQRADYSCRRWGRGTQGNSQRGLWLLLLWLRENRNLSTSCLVQVMQSVLVWVIPCRYFSGCWQESCLVGQSAISDVSIVCVLL